MVMSYQPLLLVHWLIDRQKINHIVASKQPRQQWFTAEEAEKLVNNGLGIVDWASTSPDGDVDITFASAGTEPTIETLAALWLVNQSFPGVKFHYVNVVELGRLQKKVGPLNDDRSFTI